MSAACTPNFNPTANTPCNTNMTAMLPARVSSGHVVVTGTDNSVPTFASCDGHTRTLPWRTAKGLSGNLGFLVCRLASVLANVFSTHAAITQQRALTGLEACCATPVSSCTTCMLYAPVCMSVVPVPSRTHFYIPARPTLPPRLSSFHLSHDCLLSMPVFVTRVSTTTQAPTCAWPCSAPATAMPRCWCASRPAPAPERRASLDVS